MILSIDSIPYFCPIIYVVVLQHGESLGSARRHHILFSSHTRLMSPSKILKTWQQITCQGIFGFATYVLQNAPPFFFVYCRKRHDKPRPCPPRTYYVLPPKIFPKKLVSFFPNELRLYMAVSSIINEDICNFKKGYQRFFFLTLKVLCHGSH